MVDLNERLKVLRTPNATDGQNPHILVAERNSLIPSSLHGFFTGCVVFLPHGRLFEACNIPLVTCSYTWTHLFLRTTYLLDAVSLALQLEIMFPLLLPRVLSLVICAAQRQCSSICRVGHARPSTDYKMRHAPFCGASAEAEFSSLSYRK